MHPVYFSQTEDSVLWRRCGLNTPSAAGDDLGSSKGVLLRKDPGDWETAKNPNGIEATHFRTALMAILSCFSVEPVVY